MRFSISSVQTDKWSQTWGQNQDRPEELGRQNQGEAKQGWQWPPLHLFDFHSSFLMGSWGNWTCDKNVASLFTFLFLLLWTHWKHFLLAVPLLNMEESSHVTCHTHWAPDMYKISSYQVLGKGQGSIQYMTWLSKELKSIHANELGHK